MSCSINTGVRLILLAALLTFAVSHSEAQLQTGPPDGAESQQQVSQSLAALDQFLGEGANAERWHAFLDTPALREQLQLGDETDPAVVADVLERYRSGAGGLELPRFRAVAAALEAWHAELVMPTVEELPEFARSVADDFRPKNAEDVAAAADRVRRAMAALDRMLGRGAIREGWHRYLDWDVLQAQLAAEEPALDALEAIVAKLQANVDGLELPAFMNLRDALRSYVDTYQVANNPRVREEFEKQTLVLADALAEYANEPTRDLAQTIAGRIGWFERMDQAPVLVEAVRRYHSYPNFFGYVSEGFLKAALGKSVNTAGPVRDVFQGTQIVGNQRTVGNTVVQLVPSQDRAVFDILFYGRSVSNTQGYNGPVTVGTTGVTRLSARKRVRIDADGLTDLAATAAAIASTQTTGINSGGGLFSGVVQREASSRVASSRGAANAHAAMRARQRVRAQVDAQADEFLARANSRFQAKFVTPLTRLRAFPSVLEFSTTDEYLRAVALQATASQIGAPGIAPPAPPLDARGDLGFRMHSSLVNNAAAVALAGRTLTERETEDLMVRLFGEMPEELEAEEQTEPWSITFPRQDPLVVRFEDNRVSFVLSGRRYTSGERTFGAMDVKATYELVPQGDELLLRRVGDLAIDPPGFDPDSTRLSSSQVTLRALLRNRFEKLLKPEIVVEPIELKNELARAGRLGISQAAAQDGWLVITLNRL